VHDDKSADIQVPSIEHFLVMYNPFLNEVCILLHGILMVEFLTAGFHSNP